MHNNRMAPTQRENTHLRASLRILLPLSFDLNIFSFRRQLENREIMGCAITNIRSLLSSIRNTSLVHVTSLKKSTRFISREIIFQLTRRIFDYTYYVCFLSIRVQVTSFI